MFQLEHHKFKQNEKVCITAPKCVRRIVSKEAHDSNYMSGPVSTEKKLDINVTWIKNPKFIYKRNWEIEMEESGVGRGESDDYQQRMAIKAVGNGGCYGEGPGGAGKSYTIKLITDILIEKKYKVYGVAMTHVAVNNINHCFPDGANTIQHFILNKIPKIKRDIANGNKVAMVVDEASMIQPHFWAIIANLKFLGVEFYIFGDYAGQFPPIFLEDDKWDDMDSSDFMHDLTNGLKIHFQKFRRGGDLTHFMFVISIYPQKTDLEQALLLARKNYPIKNDLVEITLCVSNNYRKQINSINNNHEQIEKKGVYLEFVGSIKNKGQSLYIWPGLILQSSCIERKSNKIVSYNLKNGLCYRVLEINNEIVTFIQLDNNLDNIGESMSIATAEVPYKLLLRYALTYHKSQATTIPGSLRLAQTDHKYFTLRHLIVGLGRGPLGVDIQVS